MKKHDRSINPGVFLFVFCCFLLLGGCGTSAITYNASASPEKLCTLNIDYTLLVKSFDGQKVTWSAGWGRSWGAVQIPEGSHTFIVDYRTSSRFASNLRYSGNFKAGRTYKMIPEFLGGFTMRIRVDEEPAP